MTIVLFDSIFLQHICILTHRFATESFFSSCRWLSWMCHCYYRLRIVIAKRLIVFFAIELNCSHFDGRFAINTSHWLIHRWLYSGLVGNLTPWSNSVEINAVFTKIWWLSLFLAFMLFAMCVKMFFFFLNNFLAILEHFWSSQNRSGHNRIILFILLWLQ